MILTCTYSVTTVNKVADVEKLAPPVVEAVLLNLAVAGTPHGPGAPGDGEGQCGHDDAQDERKCAEPSTEDEHGEAQSAIALLQLRIPRCKRQHATNCERD